MLTLVTLFAMTLVALIGYRKLASSFGLLDKPNERKLHDGSIPLIGGISICTALILYLVHYHLIPNTTVYAVCIAVLTVIGVIDDKHDLSFKIRLLAQALISVVMISYADMSLSFLGNMFGFGNVDLGSFGIVITLLAVIGAINAFNMIDGMDGLVGSLSMVTFLFMGFLFYYDGQSQVMIFCFSIVATIIPYLLFNLGIFTEKRKVFMGDAGSMMLGLTVVWILLLGTQKVENQAFNPVTALWLIALPLMDMAATMILRVKRSQSPFKPDRNHYHHVLQDVGFSKKKTLFIMTTQAIILAQIGVICDIYAVPEFIMFYVFLLLFAVHLFILTGLQKRILKQRKHAL